jgi:hypothetical protein
MAVGDFGRFLSIFQCSDNAIPLPVRQTSWVFQTPVIGAYMRPPLAWKRGLLHQTRGVQ